MFKEKIVTNAYADYKLYQKDFRDLSNSTLKYLVKVEKVDVLNIYWCTLVFKNWKSGLNNIDVHGVDEIFDELHQDVNASYYLASMGLYRTANMHLRSMIELSLQLLYFYEHPVELKRWKTGDFIIKHDILKNYLIDYPNYDPQFSKKQVDTLMGQISTAWKNYSKHIHAESLSYFQTNRQSLHNKSFDASNFEIWKSGFTKIVNKINNLFSLFFFDKLKLFPSQNKELLTMYKS